MLLSRLSPHAGDDGLDRPAVFGDDLVIAGRFGDDARLRIVQRKRRKGARCADKLRAAALDEVRHASRKLEVVPTPPDIAASLRISPFEPAVFITSCGRTASMTPVEYAESYYPAGSSSFLIEIHR